jgi:hypothetical protein
MAPTTAFGLTLACPARGQPGPGPMGSHARQATRCIGQPCHKPCTVTPGSVFDRRRTAAATGGRVVPWRAHGCPPPPLGVACGVDERPGAAGLARAGRPGQAVQALLGEHPRARGPAQVAAIRVKTPGGMGWMARAMRGHTRWWLAGELRPHRNLTLRRRLRARVRCCAAPRPLWGCSDGLRACVQAIRETCRDPVRPGAHGRPRLRSWHNVGRAPVVKCSGPRRGVDVDRRRVEGTPARIETRRRRSPGHGVLHTAASARRNATVRARVAMLTRRGRAWARCPWTRHHGRSLGGTVDNVCPPHARLGQAGEATTPAMAAALTEHGWTVQEMLACPVPPLHGPPPKRRGRPARALHLLVERWCA